MKSVSASDGKSFLCAGLAGLAVMAFMASPLAAQPSRIQTGELNIERHGHTATPFPGGKVLIIGGENQNGTVAAVETYDPGTGQFTLGASLSTPRTYHTATLLPGGCLLVSGGRTGGAAVNSTEIYDPEAAAFAAGVPMAETRVGHTATKLQDGRILIAGGSGSGFAEIYDPAAGVFMPAGAPMASARAFHGAAALVSGKVLIAGGVDGSGALIQSAEIFDPETQSFSSVSSLMSIVRVNPLLVVLPDGKVQVIGGDAQNTMEIFDPETEAFTGLAFLPPTLDLLPATLTSRARAALIGTSITQNTVMATALADPNASYALLLARDDSSLAEIAGMNKALVAGGIDSAGQALKSAFILYSSPATVTTDKIDYAPGSVVTITGTGWQPGEQVAISLHERPEGYPDPFLVAAADEQGTFVSRQFAPQAIDIGRTFTLTATGQGSGFAAQTLFSDSKSLTVQRSGSGLGAVTSSPAGINCGSTCTWPNFGDTAWVTLTAVPNSNSFLAGWSPDGGGPNNTDCSGTTGTCTINMNNTARTVTVIFTRKSTPTLSVTNSPTGWTGSQQSAIIRATGVGGVILTGTFSNIKYNGSSTWPANPGTYAVTANFVPNDTTYQSLTDASAGNFVINKADQTILIGTHAPATAVYHTSFVVEARSSNRILPIAITATGTCTGSGSGSAMITMTSGTGTCTVHYNQAGNEIYNPAPEVTETVTAQKGNQTITVLRTLPSSVVCNGSFVVEAMAGSGLPVIYSSGTPTVCTNAGSTFTMVSGTGTCVVQYDQPGDANWNPASRVTGSVTAQKAQAFISLTNLYQSYDGSAKPVTVTTNPPGLTVLTVTYNGSATPPTNAGSYAVVASLADNPNYWANNTTGTLVIGKAKPMITWVSPADITYGTPLSATQLNATSSMPGTFTYTPAAGTVLNVGTNQNLSTSFTPAEPMNCETGSARVLINVLKATPSITWGSPVDITYGTPLSATQLNATASVSGTFTYIPAAGTVLSVGSNQNLHVDFSPSNPTNYNSASKDVKVNVLKAGQTITFNALSNKTYGDMPFVVIATGGASGNPVTFAASPSTVCTATGTNGGTISIMGAGECTVTASQAGNGNYNTAADVQQKFTVSKASTSLLYTGTQIVVMPNQVVASAVLASPAPGCLSGKAIVFSVPETPYGTRTVITNGSGQASVSGVPTSGWTDGANTVFASFPGDANCVGSSDETTLTVADPGDSAAGGGWYTLSGSGRANFGLTVRKIPNTNPAQHKGQLVLINNGKWRLKGTLDTYSRAGTVGAAGGKGDLYWWNATLNGGLGAWALSQAGVTFTVSFSDGGQGGKNSGDTFGIHIDHVILSPPEPGSLPNSTPVPLKGGNISMQ